jgi:hypothetical protein
MLSTEISNIPISISILHDREYNNLCIIYKLFDRKNKRRAFSEKSINSNEKINNVYNNTNNRSLTPKIDSYRVLKN